MSDLYDTDIVLWSEQQADLLRRLASRVRPNDSALDWEHIIEEIEDVGGSAIRSVRSLLLQTLLHELKAAAWPNSSSVEHWRSEARSLRAQAALNFVPSMRQRIDLAQIYDRARRAMPDAMDGQPPLPVAPVYETTLDELLGDD